MFVSFVIYPDRDYEFLVSLSLHLRSAQVNGTIYQFGTDETGNILCTETLLQDLPPDRLDDNFQLKDALEDHRVSKDSQSSSSSDNNSTNFLRKHRLPNRRLQVGVSKLVPYIDVLVPYTRRVLCAINNDETNPLGCSVTDARKEVVLDMIQLAIFESNVAFENSGIPGRFRLKHAFLLENTPFDEQTLTWDRTLRALTRFDGVLDEIYSVRSQYDADVVSLIVDKPDSCGLSYTGFPVNKQWAFSVVNYICATGYYSFVHEIMHNLGLNHDRNTQKCKPDGTCCGENACYNFGWQDPQARFRSIGAYNCPNGYCPRVQYFSQPELSYPHIESNGQKNMIRIGNSWNNNARMIRESWSDVANFYGSSSCGNGLCEPQSGENCRTCREDCIGGYQSVTGDCGNQICEAGENCQTCPADCPGRIVDDENISYCCVGGPYEDLAKMQIKYAKPCDWNYCRWNAECDISPVKTGNYCCGNGICEPGETVDICPDCKCSEDGFCDTSFETNSCQDCPAPVVGVSACMVTGRNCANIFPDPCCKGCNGILCR